MTSTSTASATSTGSAARHAAVWGAKADDWAKYQEPLMAPLYESVSKKLGVGPKTRILDAGCGAGGFVALAKTRGADVWGLDATSELLAIARRRAPEADLRQGEIEELPYDDSSFDVVTGFNSFQYASNPTNALASARRVLRPDGIVVVATWGRQEDCEAAAHLLALKPLLPPPPPGAGGPFALSDEAALRGLVAKAGLVAVDVADVSCPFVYADEPTMLLGLMSAGPVVLAVRTSGEEKVRASLIESMAPYRTSTGGYRVENKFRYVTARRARD